MQSRPLKIFLISFVSVVLVYYSVAAAVMGCFHDDNHAHHGIIVQHAGASDQPVTLHSTGRVHGAIDCRGLDYHVESLAAPTAPAQLDRFLVESRTVSNEFPGAQTVAAQIVRALGRSNAFEGRVALTHLSAPPLYLSLAVFRL